MTSGISIHVKSGTRISEGNLIRENSFKSNFTFSASMTTSTCSAESRVVFMSTFEFLRFRSDIKIIDPELVKHVEGVVRKV